MCNLIITLILAGILAGLVQYFVDFLKLPVYSPLDSANESVFFDSVNPDFFSRLRSFLKAHWQFFGYIIVGITGAFLVPVIDQLLHLKGVQAYLDCIDQKPTGGCKEMNWNLLIIFGYGIISGYSSVRIIRGFGSFITDKIGKDLDQQKKELEDTKKEIAELKKKTGSAEAPYTDLIWQNDLLEGVIEEAHSCDASETEGILEQNEAPPCAEFPGPWVNKKWRVALSLKVLLNQVNTLAPKRNKKSDGTIGDLAHQGRTSDHNPWVLDIGKNTGIVTALDITNDPVNQCDCNILANKLEISKDKRVKYVIWNKRIMSSSVINGHPAWTWRPYTGTNPHNKHIHISVHCELCDEDGTWKI